jgi:hypothetical protein
MADVRGGNGAPLDKTRMRVEKNARGDRLLVWVVNDGVQARERPGTLSAENHLVGPALEFLQDVAAAEKDVQGDDRRLYALLIVTTPNGNGVKDIIGWVDQRYLLMRNEPMRNAETQILLKSMIVIKVSAVNEGLKDYLADRANNRFGAIEARKGPSSGAATRGEMIRLSNLFFIYAQADGYSLVGRRPFIVPSAQGGLDAARRVLLGWLPDDRLIQWRTREATYWTPDSGAEPHRRIAGEVFAERSGADAAVRKNRNAAPAPRPARVTVEEEYKPGLYGQPLGPQQMRFPILNESEPVPSSTGNLLMRVGTMGSFIGAGPGNRRFVIPANRLAMFSRGISDLHAAAKHVELLFVVDETNSLRPWFKVVGDTIERILAPIAGEKGLAAKADVRIGIAFYGDNYQGNIPAKPGRLMPAVQFARTVLPGLADHQTQDGGRDEDDDGAEQVFFGLGRAIDFAGFSPESHKLVVLIGDCGNRNDSGSDTPALEDLVEKLVQVNDKAWRPAEYYAIQVGEKEWLDKRRSAVQFRAEQIALETRVKQRIAAKYPVENQPGAAPGPEPLSDFITVNRPAGPEADAMKTSIINRYHRLRQRALEMGDELDRVRLAFGTKLSPETVQQLVARRVPIDQLRNVEGAQIFQDGYVWRRNPAGQDQLHDYLLISRGELDKFYEITAGLDLSVEQLGSLTAKQFITRMLDAMGGEAEGPDKSLSLSELVRKRSGYPVQSPLFKNLRVDAEDFQLKAQEVADIQWKRAKLRDVLDGKQRDWAEAQEPAGGGLMVVAHKPLEPRQEKESRGFYFQGDDIVLWYWIDLAEEWP